MAQDIYNIVSSTTTVNNGGLTVQTEWTKCSKTDVSPTDESLPTVTTLSTKYDAKFDDPLYYTPFRS